MDKKTILENALHLLRTKSYFEFRGYEGFSFDLVDKFERLRKPSNTDELIIKNRKDNIFHIQLICKN